MPIDRASEPWVLDTLPLIEAIIADQYDNRSVAKISGRFHRTLAALLAETCRLARLETAINRVVLSGGVFQNSLLTGLVRRDLENFDFEVFTHLSLPPNDACISFGQIVAGKEAVKISAPGSSSPQIY